MADNIPPPTGPQPNAEVAGVAAVIRLRLDTEFLARDLADAERLIRDRMGRLSDAMAQGLNASLRASLDEYRRLIRETADLRDSLIAAPPKRAGSGRTGIGAALRDDLKGVEESMRRLRELRADLATGFASQATLKSRKQALELEASALQGLLRDGKLMAAQADTARSRLDAIEGELKAVTAQEDKLNLSLQRRADIERRLSSRLGVDAQAGQIRTRMIQDIEIAGQAELQARRRINSLAIESDRERAREQREIVQADAAFRKRLEAEFKDDQERERQQRRNAAEAERLVQQRIREEQKETADQQKRLAAELRDLEEKQRLRRVNALAADRLVQQRIREEQRRALEEQRRTGISPLGAGLAAGFDEGAVPAFRIADAQQAQRTALLRAQLRELREEQERITRAAAAAGGATDLQARAFIAAEVRANALERELSQLTVQTERFTRVARETSRVQPFRNLVGPVAAGSFIGIFLSGAAHRAIAGFNRFVGESIARTAHFTAAMEQASVGLRQFVRDQQDATQLSQEAVKLAIATPFSIDQVLNATRRLLAMGTAVDEVIPRVRTLAAAVAAVGRGEGAGGNQEVFNRVILAISQIGAKSKLSMQDMRQLAEAGIPVFRILQEELGLTADQVQNIGRSGIDSARGLEAIITGLEKRFGAGLILQLNTLTGRFNNLNDIVDLVIGTLGKPIAPELTELLARLGDFLQNESTLRSAEAIGEAIAQILRDMREWLLSDTSDFQAFLQSVPGFLQAIQVEAIKVKALFDNWTVDLNLEGRPILNAGQAEGFISELSRLQGEFQAEAQRVAEENQEFRQIEMDVTAVVRHVTADVARAQITVAGKEKISTDVLNEIFDETLDEAGVAREMPGRIVEAINTILTEVDQRVQGQTGRSMAHIGAILRQSLLKELLALGDAPVAAQVDAAIGRLRDSLSIEGEFPLTDADRDILDLAESVVRLTVEEGNLSRVQEELTRLTDRHKALSRQETDEIDRKEAAIRSLNEARKAESDRAKAAIQDIRDRIDEEQRELREGDRGFEEQIRAEEQNIKRLRGIFDPIIAQHRVAYEQASAELEALRERQQDVANAFAGVTQAQERTIRDLQDARNIREEAYTTRIDEARRAEERHRRVIKDAQLDLREKIRLQDEEIDRIEEKYRGELRIHDLAVEDQDRAIRQRRREFNLQDLEFAKAIADARARGDEEEVKRLREAREQARIAFEESLEVARAELQVRQDQVEALRDQADLEARQAKQAKEDLQREGQRNLDNLERQGLALADNREAIEEERDTALSSFDRKIKIAQIFLELLNRTRQDVELAGRGQVQEAERAELAAKTALEAQEAAANGIIKGRETILQGIRDNKAEFDRQQGDILDQLNDQADALERQEAAAQRRHDAVVGPMEAELTTLRNTHEENERIRNDEIEKTRTQEAEIQKRITNYNSEIEKLGAIADLQQRIIDNEAKRGEQERASATEGGQFTSENVQKQIFDAINRQPLFERLALLSQISRLRSQIAQGGGADQAELQEAVRDIVSVLLREGLASVASEEEISRFVTGPLPASRQVHPIPTGVLELLAAIASGDRERVANLLSTRGDTLAEDIARALAGTETLVGSQVLAEKLPEALADLGALNNTLKTQLVGLLEALGVTIPEAGGAAVGPTAGEFATVRMENAADIQLEAARLMESAAQAFSDATRGRIAERTKSVIEPLLRQSGDILAGAYLGTLLEGGAGLGVRRSVLTDLQRIMDDPRIRDSIVRSISEHPEEWRFLFAQIFGADSAGAVDMGSLGFFPPSRQFIEQLDTMIAAAEEKAGLIPDAMAAAMEREGRRATADNEGFGWLADASEQAGTDASANVAKGLRDGEEAVRDGVNRGVLSPATEGFGALTTAAADAGNVGPVIQESMTTEESIAAVTEGVNTGVVTPAQAALSALAPLGELAGGDLASAAVNAAVTGLGELSSDDTKAAVGKEVDSLTGHIVSTADAGLSGAGRDIENAPMRGVGQSAAGALMMGFRDYLASAAAAQDLLDALSPIVGLAGINLRGIVTDQLAGTGQGALPAGMGGGFVNPLAGERKITTAFGQKYSPFGKGAVHRGLDIAATKGQTVYAIAEGRVSFAGSATAEVRERDPHGGYGLFVKIEHNVGGKKFSSIYANLSKLLVRAGETVKAGQAIGLAGTTGASTNPHLHLELRDAGGQPIDPLPLLPKAGGVGGSGLPLLPAGTTEGDVLGALQALAGGELGAQGVTEAESALSLIVGAKSVVEAAGGDLMRVLDAVLSGATELTRDKLEGFSEFAATTMQQAFRAMRLAIEILGGGQGGEAQFRQLLEQAGLIPEDPVEELRALLAQAGPGGFAGMLAEQLIKGSTQTVRELLVTHMPTDAIGRLIVKLIEEEFGLNISLPKLAESLVSGGQLIAPRFAATPDRDPAAQAAAQAIREFALANRFLLDELGEQVQDPAITSLLKAIRDSEAKTLDELLRSPALTSIIADDSPMGRFIALLRDISSKNPNLTLADLQGFLFGGPGFEAVDVVDATNQVLDAVNTTNAILLGATDAESIQIWKALLTEWRETAPKIAENTAMSAEQLAALMGEAEATTENTGQTAANTSPTAQTGAPGTPGGPPVPARPPTVQTFPATSLQELLQMWHDEQLGQMFGVPLDPAAQFQGALQLVGSTQELTAEQQALVDEVAASLQAEGERQDIISESERAIRDELEARRALTAAMQASVGQAPAGQPSAQQPAPVGAPAGGGSGGPRGMTSPVAVRGDTFNVYEAFDANRTAAEIQQRRFWQIRKWGE